LLTGEISVDGQRITIHCELAVGKSDRTLLPISHTGSIANIFSLQSQIVSDVLRQLTRKEDGEDLSRSGGTDNVAAYNAFLEGNELYLAGVSEETDRRALAKFDYAIRTDPNYAAAHAMRGRTLALIANIYGEPSAVGKLYELAVDSAREATRLAPQFATGFSVLGDILANRQLKFNRAREPFEIAARLGRGDAAILSRFALFMARIGEFSRAREAINIALGLDPINAGILIFSGNIEYYSGAYDAAVRSYQEAMVIKEQKSYWPYLLGLAHLGLGDEQAARAYFLQERRLVWRETGLAIVEHLLGNKAAAQEHFTTLKESQGEKSNYQYMQVLAQWGQHEAALDAMDKAWEARDSGLVLFGNDPLLDPIRNDPRAKAMLSKIGFV